MASQRARIPPEVFDREERVRRFGVDCGDELLWEDGTWVPGGEFCKTLVLKNVGNETIKIKYKPPETSFFSMDFPEVTALSPGMSFPVQVVFRPVRIEPYDDYVEFVIRNKKLKWTFYIPIRARLSNVSVSVPEMLDFGFCPISEITKRTFEVCNTGQIPVKYRWECRAPFQIEPSQGTITEAQTFESSYAPVDASVVVSKALLHVTGLESSPVVFKLSGIGKFPHVSLSEERVDFGEVPPRGSVDKEIVLRNQSFVPARFSIRRVESDLPPVFDVHLTSGLIEPGQMTPLRVRYRPTALGQFSCDSYLIETPGGNVAQLDLVGNCVGPDVVVGEDRPNAQIVQFGEFVLGGPVASAPTRALHLRNNSEKPVRYQFFTDPHSEFEFVDPVSGEIPAKLEKAITVRFRASRTGNYYRRLFCVIQDQLPLYFDLLGTCFDDSIDGRANRPQPLLARHIVAHRQRELRGLDRETPKHLLEVERDRALRGEPAQPDLVFPEDDNTVACSGSMTKGQLEVCEQLFRRATRDDGVVILDTDEVDFGGSSSLRASTDKRTIRVTNRHHAKITCGWTVNWPSSQSSGNYEGPSSEQPPFAIFPDAQDISPGRTVEFRVHFRPGVDNAYFFATASAYAHLKSNRTFRLVDDKAFIPPWFLSVRLLGHTFQPGVEHFLPKVRFLAPECASSTAARDAPGGAAPGTAIATTDSKSAFWHPLQFPVCHLGESALQTIVIENNGDTPVRFEFSNDASGCFAVAPRIGQIERGGFQIVALKSTPPDVGERKAFLKCKLNGAASNTHTLALSSFCAVPNILLADALDTTGLDAAAPSIETLFIKPTCLGLRSQRRIAVKNRSRVPLEFEWRVPKRFRSVLSVTPSRGLLRGNERTLVTWDFAPTAARAYEMDCVLFARSIWPRPGVSQESRSILAVRGTGSTSCVAFSEAQVDLGTVLAQASSTRDLGVTNHAECEVEVKFDVLGTQPEYLSVTPLTMRVPARATLPVRLSFNPQKCGAFDFKIVCTCLDQGKDTGSGAICAAVGAAADPSVVVEDARASASPAALWKQLDLMRLNQVLAAPVTDAEVEFAQCASVPGMGRSRKDELRELLDLVRFRFTPAQHMAPTEHIHLQLRNQGKLPAEFFFQFPNDSDIDIEPWADSRDPCESEIRQAFLLDQRVFEIKPRSAVLGPGEAVTIRVSYRHHIAEYGGLHQLEVLLGLRNGKQVRIALEGQTLSSPSPFVFPLARRCVLAQSPIGLRDPLVRYVELRNLGATDARFIVDEAPLHKLMQDNYEFPVIRCLTSTGTVEGAGGTARLEFVFAPLEEKTYTCRVPITVESAYPQDAEDAQIVEIDLEARGFHPGRPKPAEEQSVAGEQPPEQQRLGLPGQLASASLDLLSFGSLPIGTHASRVAFLRNHTASELTFQWEASHPLVLSGLVDVEPRAGEIAPGDFAICKVTIAATEDVDPCVVDSDLACLFTSTRNAPSRESEVTKLGTGDPLGASFRSESRASSVRRDARKKRQPVEHQSVVGRSTAARDLRMKAIGRAPPTDQTLVFDDDFGGLESNPSMGDIRNNAGSAQTPHSPGGPLTRQRLFVRVRADIFSARDAARLGDFGHLYAPPHTATATLQAGLDGVSRPSTRQSAFSAASTASTVGRGGMHDASEADSQVLGASAAEKALRAAAFHPSVQAAIQAQHEAPPPRFLDMLAAEGLRSRAAPVHALKTQQDALERRRIDALLNPSCRDLTHFVLENTLLNLIEEASRGEISLISHKTMLFRDEAPQ